MRKALLSVVLISTLIILSWGDGITITSPVAGTVWQTGTKPVISWMSSGLTGNIKIRLLNSAGVKLLNIADNVPNNNGGSYNQWEIPQTLEDGQYSVRVKTISNQFFTDSPLFRIKSGGTQIIDRKLFEKKEVKGRKKFINAGLERKYYNKKYPDFEITKIFLLADNGLVVNYKNLGKSYSGPLKIKFWLRGLAPWIVEKNVIIGTNMVMPFGSGKIMGPYLLGINGRLIVDVWINPIGSGAVNEIYRSNNYKMAPLYLNSSSDNLRTREIE